MYINFAIKYGKLLKKPNDHVTLLFTKLTNFRWPNDLNTRWLNVFLMVTVYRLLETFKVTKCPETPNLEDGGNDPKYQMTWPFDFIFLSQKSTTLKWPNDLKNQMTWHVSNGDNIKTVGNFEVIKRPETTNVKMTQNTKWPCDLIIFKINNFKVTNHVTQHESCGDR